LGLTTDVAELRQNFVKLRTLLFDQARETGPSTHHKVSGSPAPWNSTVGDLITDMHAGSRRLADITDVMLGNGPQARGSTDAGTLAALSRVATNVAQLRTRYGQDAAAMKWAELAELEVSSWAYRVRQELGELRDDELPWTKAPGGLRCPNPADPDHPERGTCDAELWLRPGWAFEPEPEVWCRQSRCLSAWAYREWSPLVA
jgi:hypothetical protein